MSQPPVRLAIVGAAGRMGQSLLENAHRLDGVDVVLAIISPDDVEVSTLGPENTPATTTLENIADVDVDVVIDFSAPESCLEAARFCAAEHIPFVSGTTGLSQEQLDELRRLSKEVALLHAANFSVGVNLLAHLVERGAQGIGDQVDIEIFEAHHRHKVDAPSGTAILLGEAAARGRDLHLEDVATWARQGHTGPRSDDEIGFQVLRGGDIVGEHSVFFCIAGERLELTHRATDRGIFARGALRAARWLANKRPGRYEMADVLFS